ncbi:response regulator transcription factor [Pseudofrankia inefficax]|uniref:Two component transcriptional regulator, winged helix family n=1 Tax=Pseudofrankia inefficax (strain DSM 45817 / CECT 9037 / DDB 130130 / EuI1c) TaxID=298654 RepID=E3J949_PSEI1|nr:response regulator transcription factor [Pseudofrankia inefficax]ADP80928.1 two component transcriptional regulator, winged helix family [Pseudofrankia inefficax]
MLTVGVCEDEDTIRTVLVRGLRQAGHEVVVAHDGREALRQFSPDRDISVIIVDIGLPDADGRDVVQALKSAGQHAPVLFLTALDATHDHLAGFAAGADDYVTKPYDLRVLLARLEVLARRGPVGATAANGLVLDPITHSARTAAGQVRLSPTEFRMLAAMTGRPNEVVRRRSVIAAAWPDGAIVNDNTVDSFIRRLRSKLDSIDSPTLIETVRGVGFTMTRKDG